MEIEGDKVPKASDSPPTMGEQFAKVDSSSVWVANYYFSPENSRLVTLAPQLISANSAVRHIVGSYSSSRWRRD